MKEQIRSRYLVLLFCLSLVIVIGAFFYSKKAFVTDNIRINQEGEIETLSKGWYYIEAGKKIQIPGLPAYIEDDGRKSLTIYRDMTGTVPEDAVLCMENHHQMVEIFVGKQKVYSYGKKKKGR